MSDMRFIEQGIEALGAQGPMTSTLTELVQLAVNAARSQAGCLSLLDKDSQKLKITITVGLPDDYVAGCGDIPLGEQCCGRAALHKKPWIVTDMLSDPLFAAGREAAFKTGIRAAFSVPVIDAQGEVLGSLACHYRQPYSPTAYEIERNHLFATLIAFALVRDRLPEYTATSARVG